MLTLGKEMVSWKRKLLRICEESSHDRKNLGKNLKTHSIIEEPWGTTWMKDRTKPLQESITTSTSRRMGRNPWIIFTHAYMHTCIHKANIFFSGKFNKADLHEMGARYTVFCGSQELKPPRHEESKGGRLRQEGEPRLSDRTLGAWSAKNW